MACRCDYPEPSERQRESHIVATLLCYLNPKFGVPVTDDIKDASKTSYGNSKMVDEWTRKVCYTCSGMSPEEQNTIIYDGRNAQARQLADWWDKHQKEDKERQEAEERAAKKKALRQEALAKLTPEQIKALGIRS